MCFISLDFSKMILYSAVVELDMFLLSYLLVVSGIPLLIDYRLEYYRVCVFRFQFFPCSTKLIVCNLSYQNIIRVFFFCECVDVVVVDGCVCIAW